MTGTPRLVARRLSRRDLPEFPLPMGRRLRPEVMIDPPPGFSLMISYQVDEPGLIFALVTFLRDELPGEVARFRSDPEGMLAQVLDGTRSFARSVAGGLGPVGPLPGMWTEHQVEDRFERSIDIAADGLVFGAAATSTSAALTRAATDFAETRILPLFLDMP